MNAHVLMRLDQIKSLKKLTFTQEKKNPAPSIDVISQCEMKEEKLKGYLFLLNTSSLKKRELISRISMTIKENVLIIHEI